MTAKARDERLALVLAVVPWLAEQGGSSIEEIGAEFGLPADEVLAVLSVVQCCELPPYGGETLGIMVDDDGTVYVDPVVAFDRPLRFSADEAFGLLAAGRTALTVPGVGLDGPLARALEKLGALVGGELVVDVETPPYLDELRQAVEHRRRLEIDYYAAYRDESTHRIVDPVVVQLHDGRWYLVAFCHTAGDHRTFRVDRIEGLRPTGDVVATSTDRAGHPPGTLDEELARIRLVVPSDRSWVLEGLVIDERAEDDDGTLRVVLPVTGTVFLEQLLLRLGPGVEVLDDPAVAAIGRAAARRLLDRYEAADPAT